MKARNMLNDTVLEFDEATTPEWAVAYAYCEEHNLASALFASAHEQRFGEFFATLPAVQNNNYVQCGDWASQVTQ